MEMEPFYVPSAQSRVWERGCDGERRRRLCAYPSRVVVLSPLISNNRGIISVSSVFADGEVEIWIEGRIDMVAEGRAYCALPTVTDEKAMWKPFSPVLPHGSTRG